MLTLLAHRERCLRNLLRTFVGTSLVFICCSQAASQSQTSETEALVWPEVDGHLQLPLQMRVLVFSGLEQGDNVPFQQWYAAAALGYQFKPILREHLINIDPDKEHYLVFGGGYEFLRTTQSGRSKDEKRVTVDITPAFRFPAEFLVRDRNYIEFRWIGSTYTTTYRNMLSVERDFLYHGFRFAPYGTAEAFHDGATDSWNQAWYTAGIQWPYKRLLKVETYYRRESCPACQPARWNAVGVTLHLFGTVR